MSTMLFDLPFDPASAPVSLCEAHALRYWRVIVLRRGDQLAQACEECQRMGATQLPEVISLWASQAIAALGGPVKAAHAISVSRGATLSWHSGRATPGLDKAMLLSRLSGVPLPVAALDHIPRAAGTPDLAAATPAEVASEEEVA